MTTYRPCDLDIAPIKRASILPRKLKEQADITMSYYVFWFSKKSVQEWNDMSWQKMIWYEKWYELFWLSLRYTQTHTYIIKTKCWSGTICFNTWTHRHTDKYTQIQTQTYTNTQTHIAFYLGNTHKYRHKHTQTQIYTDTYRLIQIILSNIEFWLQVRKKVVSCTLNYLLKQYAIEMCRRSQSYFLIQNSNSFKSIPLEPSFLK